MSHYNHPYIRNVREEILAWTIGGGLTALMLSPIVWLLLNIGNPPITYLFALGMSVALVTVGIIALKIVDRDNNADLP